MGKPLGSIVAGKHERRCEDVHSPLRENIAEFSCFAQIECQTGEEPIKSRKLQYAIYKGNNKKVKERERKRGGRKRERVRD